MTASEADAERVMSKRFCGIIVPASLPETGPLNAKPGGKKLWNTTGSRLFICAFISPVPGSSPRTRAAEFIEAVSSPFSPSNILNEAESPLDDQSILDESRSTLRVCSFDLKTPEASTLPSRRVMAPPLQSAFALPEDRPE